MVQFGPSDRSPTSFTLGMRERVGRGEMAVGGARPEPYLSAAASNCVRNTSSSKFTYFPPSLVSVAILRKSPTVESVI